MANIGNLKPPSKGGYQFTTEDRRRGGIASGEAKRRRRKVRELLEVLLDKAVKSGELADVNEIETIAKMKKTNLTAKEALALNLVTQALAGNIKATEYVLKLIDEHPKDDNNMVATTPVVIVGGDEILE